MKKKYLGQIALILLMVGPIDSVRNLPLAALLGPSVISFLLFAALLFLIPVALTSAQLASALPRHGGVYHWMKEAMGEKMGMLAVWLQWINTLIWFPTILSFIAATIAYCFNPTLAHNKTYLVCSILIIFWGMTLMNLRGLHTSVKLANICSMMGFGLAMALLIGFAIYWHLLGKVTPLDFHHASFFPQWSCSSNWISLTAIITACLGIELSTVHIREVSDPEHTFPKALAIAVLVILWTLGMGALSIATILPIHKIHLVDGLMQAFVQFCRSYHALWLIPVISLLIVTGCLGNIVSWIISPAQGLLQAAETGFLPEHFQRTNRYGVPHWLLFAQAILVTIACCAFELMPSISGSYWLLSDLCTQLYVIVYLLLFISAVILKHKLSLQKKKCGRKKKGFIIPGGFWGTVAVALVGGTGSLIILFVGFIPPAALDVGGFWHYEIMFTGGLFFLIVPVFLFYLHRSSAGEFSSLYAKRSNIGSA